MLRSTLTRFEIAAICAALLGVVAISFGQLALLVTTGAAFLIVIAFGAVLPRLSLFGPYVCQGRTARRWVALTFDDGPDGRSTPALLAFLRDAGVQAAFFCVGKRVAENPELAARIVREGHLLENHSYTHSHMMNFFTTPRLRREMESTQAIIRQTTGVAATCFRPPMGLTNPRVFRAARALGLRVIGWSARGLDTQGSEPERVVARIARRLGPGAIILLHDGNISGERLVTTVKTLLDRLGKLGYEVVRLDKMLP